MSDAYIETTILTNVLLKVGSKKQSSAQAALHRYEKTMLPVYSIKEWKAGPLEKFAWVHDKLVLTKSLRDTVGAINGISPYKPYKKSTSLEAWEAAGRLEATMPPSLAHVDSDRDLADRYRLALASLIVRSWRKRRSLATETIQDLECYTEAEPHLDESGLFEVEPTKCEPARECCLQRDLIARPDLLEALRDAIPVTSVRKEDIERRQVLRELIKNPKRPMTEGMCRRLGDAVFAFFCPETAIVLTTNIKDHLPLARAAGKSAETP